MKSAYTVSSRGYYDRFGGAWVPEMLYKNVAHLQQVYADIIESESFQAAFLRELRDYGGRPTPLTWSPALSEKHNCCIYLKREDLNHTGSHKLNNTVGQILVAKEMGKTRIIAETGAGQHGVATATVCARMGLQCVVYMGEVDMARQEPNVKRMQMLGAEVRPARSGSRTLKDATNEAIRDWINNPVDTYYLIGSVIGPHPYPDMVARLQSIISREIRRDLKEKEGREEPDALVACVGGGSNAAGTFFSYLDSQNVRLIAAEAAGKGVESGESAATSILGTEGVIHGCRTLLMQTADGQIVEPYSLSAGLDYPGIGPLHAHLITTGRSTVVPVTDEDALDAAFFLTEREGIIPALESSHALAALDACIFEKDEIVVVTVSGRGDKDMDAYISAMEARR
ncbi:MAG: tryptophan synthase subunit beta [Fibrobacterota bacterium]